MKILYTCFKGKNNASFQLVSEISGDRLYLTNSFKGLETDIQMQSNDYDCVIMFGVDKTLKNAVRIESVAKLDRVVEKTKIDIEKLKKSFEKRNIFCMISNKPTEYLCNAAYFQMLQKMNGWVVFVHIPTSKNMQEGMLEAIRISCYTG